ncbi:CoA transferase [soil metagenome]
MADEPMQGPLEGIRVVELATTFSGPYCGLQLRQLGATVIKVEAPQGDITRHLGTSRNPGMASVYLAVNGGKRSIALDLKQARGKDVLLHLLADADVLLHNMRSRATERLGIDYPSLAERLPRLIYCGIYGFGAGGPYAGKPAYDDIIQGMSGLAAVQGLAGSTVGTAPAYVASTVADKVAGYAATVGILGALVGRVVTGRGQAVEVPMFEAMTEFSLLEHQGGHAFVPSEGPGLYPRLMSANRRPYPTKDGHLSVVVYTGAHLVRFLQRVGLDAMLADPRYADDAGRSENIDDLYQIVADQLKTRTTQEWLEVLEELDIPAMQVNTPDELLEDPHLAAVDFYRHLEHGSEGTLRQMRAPLSFSETTLPETGPPSRLGEDGPAILAEYGYSQQEVDQLLAQGVLIVS